MKNLAEKSGKKKNYILQYLKLMEEANLNYIDEAAHENAQRHRQLSLSR
jgi:hypothetical protein